MQEVPSEAPPVQPRRSRRWIVIGASATATALALIAVALSSVCLYPGPHQAYSDAMGMAAAAEVYRTENDGCPTMDDLVRERIVDKTKRITDPWGNPFEIICGTSGEILVESAGPDAIRHTEDDIDFREPPPRRGWGPR